MTTTPDFEAKARETWLKIYETSMVMVHPDDVSRYVSIISSALLRAFELGCQAGHSAGCTDGVAAGAALHPGDSVWTKEMKSAAMQDAQNVCDLAMIVNKFLRRIDKGLPLENYAETVKDFMKRKRLNGSPLRGQIEEAGTADEVSAANTSASLTPKGTE